jgi:hypothetical protein
MAILSRSRWERVGYEAAPGITIYMKLRRLKRHEAKPLQRAMLGVFRKWEEAGQQDLTPMQRAEILVGVYEVIPEEQLKGWFSSCVKDVEDFEIDGEPVTTGTALLEEADDQLLFWMLTTLSNLSKLTVTEGKVSSSPALSPATQEPTSSAGPVKSTESAAGPAA